MSIAFVSKSNNITGANNTSGTIDCTGANFLIVTLNTTDSAPTITYNSVSMTKSVGGQAPDLTWQYIFTLANPSTGSHTVAITKTDGGSRAQAVSYSGVKAVDNTASGTFTDTGGAGSRTIALTVNVANCWVVATHEQATNGATGGLIVTTDRSSSTAWIDGSAQDSGGTVSSGSNNVGYSWSAASGTGGIVALSLAPSIAYTLTAAVGSFALTGIALTLTKAHNYSVSLAVGTFALTGIALTFVNSLWTRLTKNSSSFTNQAKSFGSATWDESTQTWNDALGTWDTPQTIYTNKTKSNSNFTNQPKS